MKEEKKPSKIIKKIGKTFGSMEKWVGRNINPDLLTPSGDFNMGFDLGFGTTTKRQSHKKKSKKKKSKGGRTIIIRY